MLVTEDMYVSAFLALLHPCRLCKSGDKHHPQPPRSLLARSRPLMIDLYYSIIMILMILLLINIWEGGEPSVIIPSKARLSYLTFSGPDRRIGSSGLSTRRRVHVIIDRISSLWLFPAGGSGLTWNKIQMICLSTRVLSFYS